MTREELEQLIDRRNQMVKERAVRVATTTKLDAEIRAIDGQIEFADAARIAEEGL